MKTATQPEREYRILAAGEFKARCLHLMDEVFANRNLTIIITKRGRPIAQLTAPSEGLTLSGPTVVLPRDTYAAASVAALDEAAAAAVEEHRRKKRKHKKKHK